MSSLPARLARAWRALPPERRLAAGAAVGLFLTIFLPWYQETVVAAGRSASATVTGWGAFSFVEAAVLLVAAGVLTLLFQRAEGRRFHLPGGDGGVITAAGAWTCFLVIWRILDKQGARVSGSGVADSGVEWGIFIALALAAVLAVAGSRIRRAGLPEPALGDEDIDFTLPPRRANGEPGATRRRGSGASGRGAAASSAVPSSAAARSAAARGRAAASEVTATRVRAPRSGPAAPGVVSFPVPEPLEEPPTLRFGRAARGEPSGDDEQLTIPFDEPDR